MKRGMRSTNDKPIFVGQRHPVHPLLSQVVRVTARSGSVYSGFVEQSRGNSPSFRDREPCFVWEPNGLPLAPARYRARLAGSYQGLPLYLTSVACCFSLPFPSSSSSGVPRFPAPSSSSSPPPFFLPAHPSSSSSSPASSSSSGAQFFSSSQSGNIEGCCPGVFIPDILHAAISTSQCPNLAGLVVTLQHYAPRTGPCPTQNLATDYWIGTVIANSGLTTLTVALRCNPAAPGGPRWELWAVCNSQGLQCPPVTGYPYIFTTESCNPFQIAFAIGSLSTCCGPQGGPVTITITP